MPRKARRKRTHSVMKGRIGAGAWHIPRLCGKEGSSGLKAGKSSSSLFVLAFDHFEANLNSRVPR